MKHVISTLTKPIILWGEGGGGGAFQLVEREVVGLLTYFWSKMTSKKLDLIVILVFHILYDFNP